MNWSHFPKFLEQYRLGETARPKEKVRQLMITLQFHAYVPVKGVILYVKKVAVIHRKPVTLL